MSKQVQLNGREGSNYGKVTAWMRKAQVFTKSQVVAQFTKLGKKGPAATASAVVLLSPRLEAKRKNADCRGNMSNPWGHQAYIEPLNKVKGEERKYRFRMRKTALEPLTRNAKETKVASPQKTEIATKTPVTA